MQTTLLLLGIVTLISLSECAGQGCLKSFYAEPSKTYLYLLGIAFYAIVCTLLVMSYRYTSMGLINVLWSGVSVLVIVSAGMLFFNETITRLDAIGVAMILVGMSLVLWEGDHAGFMSGK